MARTSTSSSTRRRPPAAAPGRVNGTAAHAAALQLLAQQAADDDAAAALEQFAPEVDNESASDRIAAAIRQNVDDENAVVKVYRMNDKDAKLTWCEDMAPEEFERTGYTGVRDKWGHGRFRVRLYGTAPNVKGPGLPGFGILAQETVQLAQDFSARATPAPVATPATLPPGLEQTLQAIAEGQRAIAQALAQRAEAPPMQQMTQMFGLLKMMREAFGPGDHKPAGVLEVLKEMRALKELGGDLLGNDAPPDDPLAAALPGVLDLIREVNRGQQLQLGAPGGDRVPTVSLPPSTKSLPTEAAVPLVTDPAELVNLLQRKLAAVLALAAGGVDPEEGASIIYEHLPDEFLAELAKETWFEQLQAFAPQAAPHRAWLDQARTIVLEWMAEDAAEPTGDDGGPEASPPA